MKYIGIDLGTTNSAIGSYDGENLRVFKSPEQYDVTPSVIYFDKRGNKFVGSRAYNSASRSPNNAALLFKRFMGTSTKIKISATNSELTPEECSAEILKTLFGYLPEDIRDSGVEGTVITVPAAFNQMQKDATMSAAKLAGIGNVALMQEPVAAVMSIMKTRSTDGIFLVYDLGGGTLDIAIAESISGKVNLLSHSGIAMCGGRDFDRALLDSIIRPWLLKNFNLPDDLMVNQNYRSLIRMATWAAEKAKIELSSKDEVIISLSEAELNVKDLNGDEIYIDIPLSRSEYNPLIKPKIEDSIKATREALDKAGLNANDIEKMVFIGGPTQYKPLRDIVSTELCIATSTNVNPMTAVCEGAALFAESIDWSSQNRSRKKSKNTINASQLDLSFNYLSRTPDTNTKVVIKIARDISGYEFQIDNIDTGWTSGKNSLKNGSSVSLSLPKFGENRFKIYIFDENGAVVKLENGNIIISRTAASIDAIPSSSSIGVEVRDKSGGKIMLDYLVKEGDRLPAKGEKIYKAAQSLKAGSAESLKFKLWEGEISDPVTDNNFIGMFEIKGSDFDSGVIPIGADLITEYEMLDSGLIIINVSVPAIGNSFNSGRNFYSRDLAQIDYEQEGERVKADLRDILKRVEQTKEHIQDGRLDEARDKILQAQRYVDQNDPESTKQAMDSVGEIKKLIAKTRKDNLKAIRQMELDGVIDLGDECMKSCTSSEREKFENLKRSASRAIETNSNDFDMYIDELRNLIYFSLWKKDWFVVDQFRNFASKPFMFRDKNEFNKLIQEGEFAIQNDNIDKLRDVIISMYNNCIDISGQDDMLMVANIIKG